MNEIVSPWVMPGIETEQAYECDKQNCLYCRLFPPIINKIPKTPVKRLRCAWSTSQEKYIITNWDLLNLHTMALYLGKSTSTIQLKAKELKLPNKRPVHDLSPDTGPRGALNDNFMGWF